ncbi:MAG: FG-GAP repeat domain-containing protein [Candidatus Hodarchaeota archaeon]
MKILKIFCLLFIVLTQIFPFSFIAIANISEGSCLEKTSIDPPDGLDFHSEINSVKSQTAKLSNASHPLTRNETVLMGLDEFGVIPYYTTGSIYDDANNSFTPIVSGFDPGTNAYQFAIGDYDGDGTDEILLADGVLPTCIVTMFDYANGALTPTWTRTITLNLLGWVAITAADLDADGVDEFAMLLSGVTDLGDYLHNWVYLWAYDIQEDTELVNMNVYSEVCEDYAIEEYELGWRRNWLDIEAGDFDDDGADELAFVLAVWFPHRKNPSELYLTPLLVQLWAVDDSRSSSPFATLGIRNSTLDLNDPVFTYLAPQLEVGDFDHDGVEELALMVLQNVQFMYLTHNYPVVWIFNFQDAFFFIQVGLEVELTGCSPIDGYFLTARTFLAVDIDGDFQQELAVFGLNRDGYSMGIIFDHNESIGSQTAESYYSSKIFFGANASFIHAGNILDPLLAVYSTVGDVDCDGKDEIILSDAFITMVLDDADANFTLLHSDIVIKGPVFCGNVDGDGLRVRFTGNYTDITSPPGIIAVLAAPPTQYGIQQNYASSYTAYGQETSTQQTEGNSLGHTSSTSVSYEIDIGWGIKWLGFEGLEMGWSRTWAKEHSKTDFATKIQSRSEMYATGTDHDVVLYHLTVYRCYEYEIIDHPINSSLNGAKMNLNVPISSTVHHESIPYFNAAFVGLAPQIRNETFNHTIGKPWTYPSLADMGVIAPISWRSETQTVGQGSGWIQVTIDVATETGTTMTRTKSSEYANKNSMFGAGMGHTSTCISGSMYEIIVGNSCIFEGVVGDIVDPDVFQAIRYDFGLSAYYMTHPDGPTYLVLNYWVENAVEYVPSSTTSASGVPSSTTSASGVPSSTTSASGFQILILGVVFLLIGFGTIRKKRRKSA